MKKQVKRKLMNTAWIGIVVVITLGVALQLSTTTANEWDEMVLDDGYLERINEIVESAESGEITRDQAFIQIQDVIEKASRHEIPPWEWQSPPDTVIEQGSGVEAASYIIFLGSNGVCYAKSGDNGEIMYSGDNTAVINNVLENGLTSGRTWKEKVVVKGDFTFTKAVEIPSYTNLDLSQAKITLSDGADSNIIVNSDQASGNTDIAITIGDIHGNSANQAVSMFAVWLKKVSRLSVTVSGGIYDPKSWACRIDYCENVVVERFYSESTGSFQDGLHLVDSVRVAVGKVMGTTGDDLFAITTDYRDVHDITVGSIVGSSITASGIGMYQATRSIDDNENRIMERIKIGNAILADVDVSGILVLPFYVGSEFKDIDINFIIDGTTDSSGVNVGATAKRLNLTGTIKNPARHGFVASSVEDSKFNLTIDNVGDGYNAISISEANGCEINARTDYVHTGKGSIQHNIYIREGSNNKISGIIEGGLRGIQLGAENYAVGRTKVEDCIISGQTSYGIVESGDSDNNEIVRNTLVELAFTIIKTGTSTLVRNNIGYTTENFGTATIANGTTSITVAHGLALTPSIVNVTGTHSEVVAIWVENIDATNFDIGVTAAVSANRDVHWYAENNG